MRHDDRLIESLVRLRRLARVESSARGELLETARDLEEVAGTTVGRARAARLLGITQTALDRWVDRRELVTVVTADGRRELPLSPFVELLIDVRARRAAGFRRPLAATLRERRRISLAYHRTVAERLDERLVADARKRLQRAADAGSIPPATAADWTAILELSLPEIAGCLTSPHDAAAELRQTSPFVAVLQSSP